MKKILVKYGGFECEQEVDENLYNAIYEQGRADERAIEGLILRRLATALMRKKFDNDDCHYYSKGVQALFVAFEYEIGEKNE